MLDTTTIRPLTVTVDPQQEDGSLQMDSDVEAQSFTGSDCSYPSTRSTASADMLRSPSSAESMLSIRNEEMMRFVPSSQYVAKWAEEMAIDQARREGGFEGAEPQISTVG